ncbi:MAG: acyltransferase family protein [Vicinamibacteria bacterium]
MSRSVPIDALRAFVTLLVVGHHAALAYHPYAPPPAASLLAEPVWWTAFPVVDAHRTLAAALFTGWNDGFFMALMFLLSGLFCAPSVARQGPRAFLAGRLPRLAIPFVVIAALVAPLAYYPSYLATAAPEGVAGYGRDWRALPFWPAGPGWFLWVLLAFDAAAAAAFALRPGWATACSARLSGLLERPFAAFALLTGLSALVYVPATLAFHPLHWTTVGPFAVQTSRVPLYALYFAAGVVIGAGGLGRGLLAEGGRLARRWPLWVGAAVIAFVAATAAVLAALSPQAPRSVQAAAAAAYTLSCAASSFALCAVFVRFAARPGAARAHLAASAFGIYVLHYPIVSWLQRAALGLSLPGIVKMAGVTLATIALSWALAAVLRRARLVRRFL